MRIRMIPNRIFTRLDSAIRLVLSKRVYDDVDIT